MQKKEYKCVCGFSGTEGKVLSHIMNKNRWHPEEKHGYVKEDNND